jgi:hypothetical protein
MSHDHTADAGLITDPLPHCPRCGSDRLEPVVEARVQEVHFLCQECGRCWDVGLGAVRRVPPATCSGCPARGRCGDVYALDHPELTRTAG